MQDIQLAQVLETSAAIPDGVFRKDRSADPATASFAPGPREQPVIAVSCKAHWLHRRLQMSALTQPMPDLRS